MATPRQYVMRPADVPHRSDGPIDYGKLIGRWRDELWDAWMRGEVPESWGEPPLAVRKWAAERESPAPTAPGEER